MYGLITRRGWYDGPFDPVITLAHVHRSHAEAIIIVQLFYLHFIMPYFMGFSLYSFSSCPPLPSIIFSISNWKLLFYKTMNDPLSNNLIYFNSEDICIVFRGVRKEQKLYVGRLSKSFLFYIIRKYIINYQFHFIDKYILITNNIFVT